MDTIKENKLLESSPDNTASPSPEAESEESEQLSTLFRKYSIEQYFWRNYNNKSRLKSLLLIFAVTVLAVVIAVLICTLAFPK